MAHPRKARSRVQIYYNDFEQGKQYCVDVRASKFFDVKDVQNAGVMVYDYNEKRKIFFKILILITTSELHCKLLYSWRLSEVQFTF